MTGRGRTATTRAARPLAVLGLLLGLIAMHGLAGAHHARAATRAHHAPGLAAEHSHVAAAARPATPSLPRVGQALRLLGPGAPCDDDCSRTGVLCVAVLTGAALALLLARRGPAPHLSAPLRRAARVPALPQRLARGPDPVRELGVSRT